MKALTDTFIRVRPNERSLIFFCLIGSNSLAPVILLHSKTDGIRIGKIFWPKGKRMCFREKTGKTKPTGKPDYVSRKNSRPTIIHLGQNSRLASSHLPATSPSRISGCLFDVAPRRDCPFHPTLTPARLCCSNPYLAAGSR